MTASFVVELRERIDVEGSLDIFRRSGDDLLDRWDGCSLVRTVPSGRKHIPYRASILPTSDRSRLQVSVESERDREPVAEAIQKMFSVAPDSFTQLVNTDVKLGRLVEAYPGIRPVLQHDLFAGLVRSVSAQQVNLRWASTTRGRLAERFGDRHEVDGSFVYSLNAERIANAPVEDIRALQFTTQKSRSLQELGRSIAEGRVSMAQLESATDDEVIDKLVELRGIGLWSAEWTLARTLGRPRVVVGDLGVRKAVGLTYLDGAMPTESEVRTLTHHWAESASVAQAIMLHAHALGAT